MGKVLGVLLLGVSMLAAVWAQQSGWTLSAGDERPAAHSEADTWTGKQRDVARMGTRAAFPRSSAATSSVGSVASLPVPSDIDGDGKSDLLLDNVSLGQAAFWRMDGTKPVAFSPVLAKPEGYAQAASGDFNGDGKLDIVWVRTADRSLLMWVGDGIGFAQLPIRNYSEGWKVTGAGDVNGDGRADLLLANSTQGLFAYWLMAGATPTAYSTVFASPAEHAQAATGDFNGDGKLDIVWSRASDRTLVMWIGDGSGFQQLPVGAFSAGWEISGAGDVDGDGRSDLLLYNKTRHFNFSSGPGQQLLAYWIMNGATPVRYSPVFYVPTNTVPATVGDYNGDGKLDVVLVDESRILYVALGDGFKLLPDFLTNARSTLSTGWQVVRGFGAAGYRIRPSYVRGDIDGDGNSDLLLIGLDNGPAGPSAPGKLVSYLMDGPVIREISSPIDLGCTTAKVLATGDFNADAILDVVFERNCGTRETVMRFGAGMASFVDALLPNPAPGWSIIGARRSGNILRNDLLLGQNVTSSGEMDALAYWTMEGSKVTFYSAGFLAPAGHKRLLSKNHTYSSAANMIWAGTGSDGRQSLVLWEAISTGFIQKSLPSPAAGWAVFGAGDVDGDGIADLLLSKTSGTPGLAYWIMAGTIPTRYSPGFLPPPNAYGAERIVTGDFNGDGILDLVFPTSVPCSSRNCPDGLVMWIGDGNGFRSYTVGSVSPGYSLLDP